MQQGPRGRALHQIRLRGRTVQGGYDKALPACDADPRVVEKRPTKLRTCAAVFVGVSDQNAAPLFGV